MAVARNPIFCPFCGVLEEEEYQDQSNLPFHMQLIGDTFIGYKPHKCDKNSKAYKEHLKFYDTPAGKKMAEELKAAVKKLNKDLKKK